MVTYLGQCQHILSTEILDITVVIKGLPGGTVVKNSPAMKQMQVQSLGWEDVLEKEKATHFSMLAWEIPQTEEPGRLQSMGSQSQTRLTD